jgi:DNA-binding CsgD family transcriptional regulator
MNTCTTKLIPAQKVHQPSLNVQRENIHLLQGVMEGLIDGVMIITPQGELIQANCNALQICQQLSSDLAPKAAIPAPLWRCCQAAIESRELFPQQPLTIEDEIVSPFGAIRIRVRWLNVEEMPCLLVTLEDQSQSAQYRAIAESVKYGLTARETDVWRLKRAGCSYKEIAARLYLAENTVKKHIKNIHVKRADSCSQKIS